MKKEKIVAFIRKGGEAIDMTPFYFIEVVAPIKKGQTLRWDEAEKKIVLVEAPEHP